jgi:hypothetical protein
MNNEEDGGEIMDGEGLRDKENREIEDGGSKSGRILKTKDEQ